MADNEKTERHEGLAEAIKKLEELEPIKDPGDRRAKRTDPDWPVKKR